MRKSYIKMLSIAVWVLLVMVKPICAKVEAIPSYLPVLTNRPYNMVLQLKISGPCTLDKITINTEGTTNLDEIHEIALYYLGTNYTRVITKTDQGSIFASTDKIAKQVILTGDWKLDSGSHFFALSYKISPKTNLLNRFGMNCQSIVLDGKKHKLSSPYNKTFVPAVRVRHKGDDGSMGYRIPSIVTTLEGTLIASYDIRWEGQRDLQGDMDIGISRSLDGGQTWESMRRIIDMGQYGSLPEKYNGVSDAGLLVDRQTGDIFCTGLWMHGLRDDQCEFIEGLTTKSTEWRHQWFMPGGSCVGLEPRETCQFMMTRSSDDGKTWSKPKNLTKTLKHPELRLFAPAPSHGITLDDGTLVMSAAGFKKDDDGALAVAAGGARQDKAGKIKAGSFLVYSKDHGETWKTTGVMRSGIGEAGLAQLSDGSIMFNGRTQHGTGYRGVVVTSDLGKTWQDHPTDLKALIEPSCMGSFIKYDGKVKGNKNLFLFSCPNAQDKRRNMTIKASLDECMTWPEEYQISLDDFGGGYSGLTTVKEGVIGLFYESSQGYLIFQKVSVAELLGEDY